MRQRVLRRPSITVARLKPAPSSWRCPPFHQSVFNRRLRGCLSPSASLGGAAPDCDNLSVHPDAARDSEPVGTGLECIWCPRFAVQHRIRNQRDQIAARSTDPMTGGQRSSSLSHLDLKAHALPTSENARAGTSRQDVHEAGRRTVIRLNETRTSYTRSHLTLTLGVALPRGIDHAAGARRLPKARRSRRARRLSKGIVYRIARHGNCERVCRLVIPYNGIWE